MDRLAFVLLSLVCLTFPASADRGVRSIARVMSAAEVKNELFGVHLAGEAGITASQWNECIEPDGRTVYQLDGVEMIGRMSVTSEGLACFAYEHLDFQNPSCFRVSRSSDGYSFWGGAEGVFNTTSVRRGVEACPQSISKTS